jgi:hypothetical protein
MAAWTCYRQDKRNRTQVTFELFRDQAGHWCARRADGRVGGTFFERDAAVRFARRECRDGSALILIG